MPCGRRPGPETGTLAGRGNRRVPRRADHEDHLACDGQPTAARLHPDRRQRTKIRSYLRRCGTKAAIPKRIDQINGRIRRGESLCRLDLAAYRRRGTVERCSNKRKHNKALATRYDKRTRHYQALVTIACLRL
ncbi:hypothetical protein SALBM135S_05620 [Streptomyces alboniger]